MSIKSAQHVIPQNKISLLYHSHSPADSFACHGILNLTTLCVGLDLTICQILQILLHLGESRIFIGPRMGTFILDPEIAVDGLVLLSR